MTLKWEVVMNYPQNIRDQNPLKRNYLINFEIGVILSLLIFITAFKVEMKPEEKIKVQQQDQEVVKMEEVVRTKQQEQAPAPPRPQSPVEVPNDEVIEEQSINLDAELDMGESLEMPEEPPPSAEEEENNKDSEIFVVVERMPQLKGGMAEVQKLIEYPEMARKAGIEGKVIVQFVVDENGSVQNPKVMRGIGGGCDKEALRVVKQLDFKPGMQRGKTVKVQYTMPIIFRLEDSQTS